MTLHSKTDTAILILELDRNKSQSYSYRIDQTFFSFFEHSLVKNCSINLQVLTENSNRGFNINLNFKGKVFTTCDKCLDALTYDIDFKESIFLYYKNDDMVSKKSTNNDIYWIEGQTKTFCLDPVVYDIVNANVPISYIHSKDDSGNLTCNKSMLNILKQLEPKGLSLGEDENIKKILSKIIH